MLWGEELSFWGDSESHHTGDDDTHYREESDKRDVLVEQNDKDSFYNEHSWGGDSETHLDEFGSHSWF